MSHFLERQALYSSLDKSKQDENKKNGLNKIQTVFFIGAGDEFSFHP
jgi:hypothetical protein